MIRVGLLATALAAPAAAQERFAPPSGCGAFLTVQTRGCTVEHFYACSGEPADHVWTALMDADGVVMRSLVGPDTQWLRFDHPTVAERWDLRGAPADPQSLSGLLETGRSESDFVMERVVPPGRTLRYRGDVRLTGEVVVIDGEALEATTYTFTAAEGGRILEANEAAGHVSRDRGLVFGGVGRNTTTGYEWDSTPVEFAEPGEEGFLDARPRHGCDALMSSRDGANGTGAG